MATLLKYLEDAKIKIVSLVKNPANRKVFTLKKSEKKDLSFNIIKSEKKGWSVVKGIVYEPETPDTDGHQMTAEEIQKMAHYALENGVSVDIEHDEKITSNSVVESYIAEKDEKINGQVIKKGSWVVAVKIKDEEIKKAVDDGDITAFSMAGEAIVKEVKEIEKASLKSKFSGRQIKDLAWSFANVIEETFREDLEGDELIGNLELNLDELTSLMTTEIEKLKTTKVNKSEGKIMPDLTEEKIAQMIAKGVIDGIAAHEASKEESLKKSAKDKKIDDLEKTVGELKEKVLKSGASKDGGEDVKKSEKKDRDYISF